MPLTYGYPGGVNQFPRSYIKGFVSSAGCFGLTLSGNYLSYYYLSTHILVKQWVKTEFLNPNSNVYSLDYVFDGSLSEAYIDGVPAGGTVYIRFHAMVSEPTWRIQVLASFAANEADTADLVPLAGYWRTPV
jgi:hypothetical protein